MKFIHLYTAWMVGLFAARLLSLISKSVFEALVILGIAIAAASSYKSICELDYSWHKERAKSN